MLINQVDKNGYRRHICTSKTTKIHRFVRFVMYCIITTYSVECYWHCMVQCITNLTKWWISAVLDVQIRHL